MTIEHVLAVVPVADFDAAHAWYERLFGRPADATAALAAIVELPADRSGVGSALLQTVIKLGPAFGAAILGIYQSQVDVSGLPGEAATAVQGSVFGGIAVAQQLGSPALLASVQAAFMAAVDEATRIAAVVDVVAVALALVFLPSRVRAARTVEPTTPATGSARVG